MEDYGNAIAKPEGGMIAHEVEAEAGLSLEEELQYYRAKVSELRQYRGMYLWVAEKAAKQNLMLAGPEGFRLVTDLKAEYMEQRVVRAMSNDINPLRKATP